MQEKIHVDNEKHRTMNFSCIKGTLNEERIFIPPPLLLCSFVSVKLNFQIETIDTLQEGHQ